MSVFRVYTAEELGDDGYPHAWHQLLKHQVRAEAGHRCIRCHHPYRVGVDGVMEPVTSDVTALAASLHTTPDVLDHALELIADDTSQLDEPPRLARRQHWSACDAQCTHRGPYRYRHGAADEWVYTPEDELWIGEAGLGDDVGIEIQALWRILTVHHLDGVKANCRWWNLVALCQRCHLTIQGKVQMARVWPWEHSEWFQPYVAGFYAATYLGEELTRSEVDARLDELLALERVA